mmetsp:Transcript_84972/g.169773  ORF Transcript_84972/g.169773 Transcript_84972/m.169773 type:complete len:99 (+) Transcript_84972:157-453(+)
MTNPRAAVWPIDVSHSAGEAQGALKVQQGRGGAQDDITHGLQGLPPLAPAHAAAMSANGDVGGAADSVSDELIAAAKALVGTEPAPPGGVLDGGVPSA